MQITKNADTLKYDYKGYGICFDEGGQFGHTITEGGFAHTTNARNVLIFGTDMSFSVHAINTANHIYVMGKDLYKVFIILQFMQKRAFIEILQTLVKKTEKTGLHGNIYDFVVDYEQIVGVKAIYDMLRYLMAKDNISP